MQDFIPQEGAPPAGPAQAGTSGAPPTDFISPADKSTMVGQATTQPPPPGAPAGVPQGAGMAATQEDPFRSADEQASPEEQEEYQDLFNRVMSAVNDTRQPEQGDTSPADAVIKMLSVKGKPAYVAIGTVAGLIMTQMTDMAKRAGTEYSGPVIQEVGMDLIVELIELAEISDAIENLPKDGSEEYDKLLELAALEGAKHYGEWQLRTGQADQEGHMREIEEQMQREADGGELEDWGMEELDPEMRTQIAQNVQGQGQPQGGV